MRYSQQDNYTNARTQLVTVTKRIAVVGTGYWGRNLVRNFHALDALEVVCDSSEATLADIAGYEAKVRDPARVYEIHLMKDLRGFRRNGWTTDFTNYRFAIPQLAGRSGRAIYNDVDQIYLDNPARLFDLDLDGHLDGRGGATGAGESAPVVGPAVVVHGTSGASTRRPVAILAPRP